jgi:hypothetical protein
MQCLVEQWILRPGYSNGPHRVSAKQGGLGQCPRWGPPPGGLPLERRLLATHIESTEHAPLALGSRNQPPAEPIRPPGGLVLLQESPSLTRKFSTKSIGTHCCGGFPEWNHQEARLNVFPP